MAPWEVRPPCQRRKISRGSRNAPGCETTYPSRAPVKRTMASQKVMRSMKARSMPKRGPQRVAKTMLVRMVSAIITPYQRTTMGPNSKITGFIVDSVYQMPARRRSPPPSAPGRIAIGSQHPAKVAAATAVLRQAFPHAEIIALTVDSGVRPAPTSAEETIQGALGRARRALEEAGADLGIDRKSTRLNSSHGTFLGGWAAVVDR